MSDVASAPPPGDRLMTRRRTPRWLWALLIVSLAANLFVVGVIARVAWPYRYATAQGGPGGLVGNLMAYTGELPADRRAALHRAGIERPALAVRPLREDLRNARREAARLFRADPFDRAAFLAAEARIMAADAKLREAMARYAADLAEHMTADERVGFLRWRELRRINRWPQAEREPDPAGDAPMPKKP